MEAASTSEDSETFPKPALCKLPRPELTLTIKIVHVLAVYYVLPFSILEAQFKMYSKESRETILRILNWALVTVITFFTDQNFNQHERDVLRGPK
jgi:hypothetical protein